MELNNLPEGRYYACLYARVSLSDLRVFHGASNNGLKIVFDKTAPVVSIASKYGDSKDSIQIDLTVSDSTEVKLMSGQK